MRISVRLQERFEREAEISFYDRGIDLESREDVREKLEEDLQNVLKVFGGLIISMIEDRLAYSPDQHGVMEDLLNLLESHSLAKVRQHGETMR